MKKSMLIQELVKNHNLSNKEMELIINDFFDIIIRSLRNKEPVSLIGFGSFVPVKRKEREVYLPGTTTKVKIKSKYGIKFRPSKKLQKLLEQEIGDENS
jgi:nucleoid DNA-binding protein